MRYRYIVAFYALIGRCLNWIGLGRSAPLSSACFGLTSRWRNSIRIELNKTMLAIQGYWITGSIYGQARKQYNKWQEREKTTTKSWLVGFKISTLNRRKKYINQHSRNTFLWIKIKSSSVMCVCRVDRSCTDQLVIVAIQNRNRFYFYLIQLDLFVFWVSSGNCLLVCFVVSIRFGLASKFISRNKDKHSKTGWNTKTYWNIMNYEF